MKTLLKKFILYVVNIGYKKQVKNIILEVQKKSPLGLIITNFIFQNILRNNSNVDFPVHYTTRITDYENIRLNKDKVTIQSFAVSGACYIQAVNGINIGKNFLFAPGLKLISSNHDVDDYSISIKEKPISIGDNVWIGANVSILPGVTLGNNCIIGAGAVVTKSFLEDNVIIAGNPAKIIKRK